MGFEVKNNVTSGILERIRQECEDKIAEIKEKMKGMDENSLEYTKQRNFLRIFQKELEKNSDLTPETKEKNQKKPVDNKETLGTNEFGMRR